MESAAEKLCQVTKPVIPSSLKELVNMPDFKDYLDTLSFDEYMDCLSLYMTLERGYSKFASYQKPAENNSITANNCPAGSINNSEAASLSNQQRGGVYSE